MTDVNHDRVKYARESDEELVALSLHKDDHAFMELVTRYAGPVRVFALQYAKDQDDAEDIAQDSFFKAWKNLKRFRIGAKWKPWLYTIVRNTALDYVKKKRPFVFSDLSEEDEEISFTDTIRDPEPLPDEVFRHKEVVTELSLAMKELRPDQNAVIFMHYHDGMTFDEIAEVLGKPMNTVKSWHRRALIKIREMLVHHHFV